MALAKSPLLCDAAQDDERVFGATFREWLAANLPSHWREDSTDYQPLDFDTRKQWEKRLSAAGYVGITWPIAYGGRGLTIVEQLIVNEKLGDVAAPEIVNSGGTELAGPILLALGTDAQKRRFLPRIVDMSEIWCQGFSEPEAGSDLAGLKTRATRDGGGWRIDGQKLWTSNALNADWCLLLTRTGPSEARHRSLTLFAVPMRSPGIVVRPIRQMTGRSHYCEVFFDNVGIDGDSAIGTVNEGWRAAVAVLEFERATNRLYRANRFRNEFHHLLRVCHSSPELARRLDDAHFRQRLIDAYVDIEILRRHVRRAVATMASGGRIDGGGTAIKLHWSEARQRFLGLALEILDRAPLSEVVAAAQRRFFDAYLESRGDTIHSGTSEIQLNIVADRVLRLPKD